MSWQLGVICCDEGREWALTTHQWATLTYLALIAGMETKECSPKMSAIAEATKQTKKSARAKVQELEKLGYLSVVRKSGNGGRNTYRLLVDKFLKGERGDPLKGNVATPLGGTIGGVEESLESVRVSKLVGTDPHAKKVVDKSGGKTGENHPAEELLVNRQKSVLEIAPSARYDAKKVLGTIRSRRSDEEYQKLMREPRWKPITRADRLACVLRCQAFGASADEAHKFVGWNAVRKWTACETASINDLAQMWVENWKRESPDEWRAEQARRRYEAASRTID